MYGNEEITHFSQFIVRTWHPRNDASKFYELIQDEGFRKFSLDKSFPKKEECEDILYKVRTRFFKDGLGVYGVFSKITNDLIGTARLYYIENTDKIEISIRLAKKYQGKKIGYHLSKSITSYAIDILKISKLYAVIDPDNIISIKLFESIGYRNIGQIKYLSLDMELFCFSR